jgi:hypothetical protein
MCAWELKPGVDGSRSNLHRQSVAPSVFAIRYRRHLFPQVLIGTSIKYSRRRVSLPLSESNSDPGITPDVLDPPCGFTALGEQVKPFSVDDKPNLDLARVVQWYVQQWSDGGLARPPRH